MEGFESGSMTGSSEGSGVEDGLGGPTKPAQPAEDLHAGSDRKVTQ